MHFIKYYSFLLSNKQKTLSLTETEIFKHLSKFLHFTLQSRPKENGKMLITDHCL